MKSISSWHRFRDYLAAYTEAEDLINIGAYVEEAILASMRRAAISTECRLS